MSSPFTPALSLAQRSLILAGSLALTAAVLGANLGLAGHYASHAETVTLQARANPGLIRQHFDPLQVASGELRQP